MGQSGHVATIRVVSKDNVGRVIVILSVFLFSQCAPAHAGHWNICRLLFRPSDPLREDLKQLRILGKKLQGRRTFAVVGGSAFLPDSEMYKFASDSVTELIRLGFDTVITGAGPGIMEAANKTAKTLGALSIGVDLRGDWPAHDVGALDSRIVLNNLEMRKLGLFQNSSVVVVFPGGLGSMDELFSVLGSKYSGTQKQVKIFLMGSAFWTPILEAMKKEQIGIGAAKASHFKLFEILSSPAEFEDYL